MSRGAGGIDFVENSPGVSMLSIDSEYERLFLLAAQPTGFAFTGDARQVFVQLGDVTDPVQAVEQINLTTFAQETIYLPTRPIAIGWMPVTGLVYVAQDSAAGRISFIEPESGNVEHVAGFGLNSWIGEGGDNEQTNCSTQPCPCWSLRPATMFAPRSGRCIPTCRSAPPACARLYVPVRPSATPGTLR